MHVTQVGQRKALLDSFDLKGIAERIKAGNLITATQHNEMYSVNSMRCSALCKA